MIEPQFMCLCPLNQYQVVKAAYRQLLSAFHAIQHMGDTVLLQCHVCAEAEVLQCSL